MLELLNLTVTFKGYKEDNRGDRELLRHSIKGIA